MQLPLVSVWHEALHASQSKIGSSFANGDQLTKNSASRQVLNADGFFQLVGVFLRRFCDEAGHARALGVLAGCNIPDQLREGII